MFKTITSNDYKLSGQEGQVIHVPLGGAIDDLMEHFSNNFSLKNISLILCGMKNFEELMCL